MTSEGKAPTCDGSAQFRTVWQRHSSDQTCRGNARHGIAKAQYGPEQRRRGEAWQSGGREEKYTARNRHGVDLRSKDGHRQSGEKRRVATEGLRIAKNGTASQRHGAERLSIGKAWQGAATAMRRSYRNREEKQTIMKGRYES